MTAEHRIHPVMLVHGGLAEMIGAAEFWVRPGIVDKLTEAGLTVIARDRHTTPPSWKDAARDVAAWTDCPATIVAASNAVSVAVRLAVDHPDAVYRLVLLWPTTAGDPVVDATAPAEAAHLLAGETLRGVADSELARLDVPTAVMPSEPENPFHQRHTVDRLLALIPRSTLITPGCPESPRPEFPEHLDAFIDALLPHL